MESRSRHYDSEQRRVGQRGRKASLGVVSLNLQVVFIVAKRIRGINDVIDEKSSC